MLAGNLTRKLIARIWACCEKLVGHLESDHIGSETRSPAAFAEAIQRRLAEPGRFTGLNAPKLTARSFAIAFAFGPAIRCG